MFLRKTFLPKSGPQNFEAVEKKKKKEKNKHDWKQSPPTSIYINTEANNIIDRGLGFSYGATPPRDTLAMLVNYVELRKEDITHFQKYFLGLSQIVKLFELLLKYLGWRRNR